jgi:hypothetical protein
VSAGGGEGRALLYTLDARTGRVEKRVILEEDALAGNETEARLSPNGRAVVFLDRAPPPGCVGDACDVFTLFREAAAGGPERRVRKRCGNGSWSSDSRVLLYIGAPHRLELRVLRDGRRRTITIPANKPLNGRGAPVLQP